MREVVKYFGYGANRDPLMMSYITGRCPELLVGRPAVLRGWGLAIQAARQIPGEIRDGSELLFSPKDVILSKWDPTFRTYVIHPKEQGIVLGTVWDLTPEDRERVKDWELVGDWYQEAHGLADVDGGSPILVETEAIGPGQEFDFEVNGLDYKTWLQDPSEFEVVAAAVRAEYDSRNS